MPEPNRIRLSPVVSGAVGVRLAHNWRTERSRMTLTVMRDKGNGPGQESLFHALPSLFISRPLPRIIQPKGKGSPWCWQRSRTRCPSTPRSRF